MKKTASIIIIYFLLLHHIALSQKINLTTTWKKQIGLHILNNISINGNQFLFQDKIITQVVDTTKHCFILILLSNRRVSVLSPPALKLVVFDYIQSKPLWHTDIDDGENRYYLLGKNIFRYYKNKSSLINTLTGEEIWTTKYKVILVVDNSNLALVKRQDPQGNGVVSLDGIDLKTGQKLWTSACKLDRKIDGFTTINNNILLLKSNGLHAINMHDGSGWNWFNSTIDEKGTFMGMPIFGEPITVVLSEDYFEISSSNVIDIQSNTLIESNSIYFATKNILTRKKFSGEKIWEQKVDKKYTSKSFLFSMDEKIFMINLGYAYIGNTPTRCGVPYLKITDKNTGKELHFETLSEDPILKYYKKDNLLYLLNKSEINVYNLATYSFVQHYKLPYLVTDSIHSLAYTSIKLENDKQMLTNIFDNHFCYYTKDSLIDISSDFSTIKYFDANDVYYSIDKYKDLYLYSNKKTIGIYNNLNQKVARLDFTGDTYIIQNKLYCITHNSIFEVDLKSIL